MLPSIYPFDELNCFRASIPAVKPEEAPGQLLEVILVQVVCVELHQSRRQLEGNRVDWVRVTVLDVVSGQVTVAIQRNQTFWEIPHHAQGLLPASSISRLSGSPSRLFKQFLWMVSLTIPRLRKGTPCSSSDFMQL